MVTSIYFIEVVIAVVSGYALIKLWKTTRKADGYLSSRWRRASYVIGWILAATATIVWAAWVYVMIANLLTAMNPSMPKPPAILYFVMGALLYMMAVGFAGSAFDASGGSARDDIRRRIGR